MQCIIVVINNNNMLAVELMDSAFGCCQVEIVENYALQQLFELTKKRITGKPKHLYQRVPAQCCHLVSWVGFQRDYAPPDGKYAIFSFK